MVPLPFPRVYLWLGVGAIIIGVFLYVRFLQARVDYWKLQTAQVQAMLDTERAGYKIAMEAADAKHKQDLSRAATSADETRRHLANRLDYYSGAAADLEQRLRNAEKRRLRPLAPAASAPADCGNYEADPTKLSGAHRGFLIGEAAAAEEQGELLEACRADYETVKIACGVGK
jgi:hypothetical protein